MSDYMEDYFIVMVALLRKGAINYIVTLLERAQE